jgi:hypothetical protein
MNEDLHFVSNTEAASVDHSRAARLQTSRDSSLHLIVTKNRAGAGSGRAECSAYATSDVTGLFCGV